jgi:hypothetical protein
VARAGSHPGRRRGPLSGVDVPPPLVTRSFLRFSQPPQWLRASFENDQDRFEVGTGTPATLTLKEPRLVRVQKKTVFQSSPPKATLAVFWKPCTMRPSFLPFGSMM